MAEVWYLSCYDSRSSGSTVGSQWAFIGCCSSFDIISFQSSKMHINTSMMQNFGFEDLAHWPSRQPSFKEFRTGVFSWCVISWFYFLWNVNLGNYSSWLVTWRFCVIREEPEFLTDICDFTTLFYVIFRRKSSKWSESSIESDLGMRFAIWSVDFAICDFTFFKHCFWCKNRSLKRVSYFFTFVIRENEGDPLFFCPWTVPETPPVRPSLKYSCLSGDGFWLVYEDLSINFGWKIFLQNRDMACKLGCGLFLSPQLCILLVGIVIS